MERDNDERILRLISVLRNITLAVQVVPFVYSLFYIVSLILAFTGAQNLQVAYDMMFYVSPVFVLVHFAYNRILHLCVWHRTACALPLIPQFVSVVDYYVIDMSEFHAAIFNIILLVMFVMLLVAAYNVFLKPKSKNHARR